MQIKKNDPDTNPYKEAPQVSPSEEASLRDKRLVSLGGRVTYTFSHDQEIGSIHFDRAKNEIFYKGHNIRNMDLAEWQMQVLEEFRGVLKNSREHHFYESYARLLDKIILEKQNVEK